MSKQNCTLYLSFAQQIDKFAGIKPIIIFLLILSATATLEVLGSIPRSSKKCYWVFLWNSQ